MADKNFKQIAEREREDGSTQRVLVRSGNAMVVLETQNDKGISRHPIRSTDEAIKTLSWLSHEELGEALYYLPDL